MIVDRNPLNSKDLCGTWRSRPSPLHLPAPPQRHPQREIGVGGRNRFKDVAFLRKRAGGSYSLSSKSRGESYIKALGTDDEHAAESLSRPGVAA